jgi:hypothetical protein
MSRFAISCAIVLACFLAIASTAAAQPKPDSSYGAGGSKSVSTSKQGDTTVETTTWRDKGGTVRQQFTKSTDADGNVTETEQWFNQAGMKIGEEVGKYDKSDYCYYWREEDYFDDGVLEAGDIWEDDPVTGREVHKKWNRETQRYDVVPVIRFDFFKIIPGFKKATLLEPSYYIGGAVVFEDSGQRFATYGVEGSYTHPLNPRIGLMADAQWTRGTQDETTWTKLQFLAGLALCEHIHNQLYLGPHLLAGMARVTPDYGGTGTGTATNAFALAVGMDFGARLNRSSTVLIRGDYNPTFSGGSVQNNFRISAGMRFNF